ncbi:MAG: cupredoxin domain-containing protein [Candidatus Doudnabacteria bacterium]|nr:cupredoxin domain-containing protein [Candidatus Doudnabacteria bacterium]
MAETSNKQKNESSEEFELNYSVMPQEYRGELVDGETVQPVDNTEAFNAQLPEEHVSVWHNKSTYVIVGILILLALGAMAYFLLWSGPASKNSITTQLPAAFLKVHFGVEECAEPTVCGDLADPDNDGLSNLDEFKNQTEPRKNDTDEDGLADGDEVFIYLTIPNKKFTDSRPISIQGGYDDGSQIKNSYDPLTPGLKMNGVRLKQISEDQKEFGLHQPTIATMQASATPQPKTVNIMISNNKFSQSPVTIDANDTVIWVNQDTVNHQIASDPHPTHTDLPELESGLLATNQTYNFKFTTSGTFNYHDHLNPSIKGVVIVK